MLLSNNVNLTEEQCCPTFPVQGGDFGVKTHTISGYGPIAAATATKTDPIQSHIFTQLNNNRPSGQLGPHIQGQCLGKGVKLLGQEFWVKLLPPGYSQSIHGTPNFPAQGPRLPHLQGTLSSQVQSQRKMLPNCNTGNTSQQNVHLDNI
ncbi:uncharacterized protein LOC127875040 [Dreissena polymorpha]|uniref:uncharacterized protein LOC127875040 n=1 Tax=Dreissena polymorpha TaxID=45954 RepID=UPI0022656B23|nr:uncharacterized protein LOC127875040 [Dreissena polymorpha]